MFCNMMLINNTFWSSVLFRSVLAIELGCICICWNSDANPECQLYLIQHTSHLSVFCLPQGNPRQFSTFLVDRVLFYQHNLNGTAPRALAWSYDFIIKHFLYLAFDYFLVDEMIPVGYSIYWFFAYDFYFMLNFVGKYFILVNMMEYFLVRSA